MKLLRMIGVAAALACTAFGQAQNPSIAPWLPQPGIAKGRIQALTFESRIYKRPRKVWIYTPSDYKRDASPAYDVLFCFDGDDYINDISAPAVLDNEIAAKKIPPLVAIFIDNSVDRLGDLANHEQFADFMATELVPWARRNANITTDPQHTIIAGYSAGGLGAAYVAYKHPELFGKVLSQSGAFWRGNEGASEPYEWLTRQFAESPRKNLRFYVEVGAEEKNHAVSVGPVFIEATRRFRDALLAKGYPLSYREIPGAHHEPSHWRTQFGPGLLYLTGNGE